jgi:hypothetical protein
MWFVLNRTDHELKLSAYVSVSISRSFGVDRCTPQKWEVGEGGGSRVTNLRPLEDPCASQLTLFYLPSVGAILSGHMMSVAYGIGQLKHWDRGFQSHPRRQGHLFFRWADLPSKEPYQNTYKGFIVPLVNSELEQANGPNTWNTVLVRNTFEQTFNCECSMPIYLCKGKVVPVLLFFNWGPRYEGVLGSGGIVPFILWPRH